MFCRSDLPLLRRFCYREAVGAAKTIGIELWDGQARGGQNVATCYRPVPRVSVGRSMRQLFIGAYQKFADLCRDVGGR